MPVLAFDDLRHLLLRLGFSERIRGDHHIYLRAGIEEILNLQPKAGMAKPYQVKQVRGIILETAVDRFVLRSNHRDYSAFSG